MFTTHLGMVYTTYKNGDLGIVYYCFTHIMVICPQVIKRGWLKTP